MLKVFEKYIKRISSEKDIWGRLSLTILYGIMMVVFGLLLGFSLYPAWVYGGMLLGSLIPLSIVLFCRLRNRKNMK